MQRHVAHWQDLLNSDMTLAFILDLKDEQAARAIGASDPAVKSGSCTYEVVPMQLVRPG